MDNFALNQRITWQKDRMILDDLVFRLEHYRSDDWELGDECFCFFKTKYLVDQYAQFWATRPNFHARRILELGIWDGGSIVFWFEWLQPEIHVAVDIMQRKDSAYFRRWVATRSREKNIRTYWGTDQADGVALRQIVARDCSGELDLVIDDASHMYEPTKRSFEALFPLLRPGGLYIIEDWAWGHWEEFQQHGHPWAREIPLTRLILELIEATGSWRGSSEQPPLIANVSIYQGFAVIERGGAPAPPPQNFELAKYIYHPALRQYLTPDEPTSRRTRKTLSFLLRSFNRAARKLGLVR